LLLPKSAAFLQSLMHMYAEHLTLCPHRPASLPSIITSLLSSIPNHPAQCSRAKIEEVPAVRVTGGIPSLRITLA
jgi:hypothetical protein